MELTEAYFEKTKTDNWFIFGEISNAGNRLVCVFEENQVYIYDGDLNYPLKHIKTIKQWEDLHVTLTGKKI